MFTDRTPKASAASVVVSSLRPSDPFKARSSVATAACTSAFSFAPP